MICTDEDFLNFFHYNYYGRDLSTVTEREFQLWAAGCSHGVIEHQGGSAKMNKAWERFKRVRVTNRANVWPVNKNVCAGKHNK